MHLLHVVGARPNFMKVAPVIRAFGARSDVEQTLVHTGQHYDPNLSDIFFEQLEIPRPDVSLEVGSGSHARQTAEIMIRFEEHVLERQPDWVMVYGDINSTVAAALVAAKLGIKVAHVEAGLRSFDRTMPEELNRLVTDQLSDLLLTSSPEAEGNLANEGISGEKVHFVGNVMIDTLLAHRERALALDTVERLGLSPQGYAVLTLHRPSNVDSPDQLRRLFDVLGRLNAELPVVFPVHPRTAKEHLMQTHLHGRDMITTQEWTKDELDTVIDIALDLKRRRALGEPHPLLRDKVLAMLFFFASTRTRASFEAGMAQLGGHAMFLDSTSTQIGHGDTWKEIGEILGRYNDGIAIRQVDWGIGNDYSRAVAEASRTPVLNMQCDWYHPHQALADLLTIIEQKGDPSKLTINMSYAYASSYQKPISVPQSVILLMTRYGANVRLTRPPEFKLMPEIVAQAEENAKKSRGSFEIVEDFEEGMRGADVVYAKAWGSMLTTSDLDESSKISDNYTDWIVDPRRMEMADEDAIYMHPLPADRNIEVTDAVIDGRWSRVFDQAENRLHVQKAVMALTM